MHDLRFQARHRFAAGGHATFKGFIRMVKRKNPPSLRQAIRAGLYRLGKRRLKLSKHVRWRDIIQTFDRRKIPGFKVWVCDQCRRDRWEGRKRNGRPFGLQHGKAFPRIHMNHRQQGSPGINTAQHRQNRCHMEHRKRRPKPVLIGQEIATLVHINAILNQHIMMQRTAFGVRGGA